jgi:Ca-activated chloride channel family protein
MAQVKPQPSHTPESNTTQQQSTNEEAGADDVIRVKTTLVTSPVLVTGRDGKLIPNLRQEDFRVFEDGVEQSIAYFAPVDKPFTTALVIDTSHSVLSNLSDLQDAAISFVDGMRPNDRALVVSFDDKIKILAEPTSDHDALRRAIRNIRPGGSTRLYDAVEFIVKQRMKDIARRKAILLFTDGVDTASRRASYASSLREIENSDVVLYPIQFSTYSYMNGKLPPARRAPPGSGFSTVDYTLADAYLHQLADVTGVALYPAADISDLGRAVQSIVDEMHNEYSLGYYPAKLGQPGEQRRIEVRLSRPQLLVRARTSYTVDRPGIIVQPPRRAAAPIAQLPGPSGFGALPVSRDMSFDKSPTRSRWMCKGPNVESDFAVVREGFDSACPNSGRPNDRTNAWLIRKPGPSETVCKGFFLSNGREMEAAPVPAGYVVVGQLVSPGCSRSNDPQRPANAWSVKLPGQSETVCKGFQIPPGYVVRGETDSRACPAKSEMKNAWLIRQRTDVETRRLWAVP